MAVGQVISIKGRDVVVESGGRCYNCVIRGRLRLRNSRSTNPVAVGDFVVFEPSKAANVISDVQPRRNCIVRKATNLSREQHVIAANVDMALFIHTLKMPETSLLFLDRFLVAAEAFDIPVTIIFNKTDIYDQNDLAALDEIVTTYKSIGYATLLTSVLHNRNLAEFRSILSGRTTVLVGNSGVGKSSLVRAVAPEIDLKIGDISSATMSGRHTTTFARMYTLPFGGRIIDTPGIRAFGLNDYDKNEIYHYFPEIFRMSSGCRYYNCTHTTEPDCAVQQAVEQGVIALSRYKSYLNIFYDEHDKYRMQND